MLESLRWSNAACEYLSFWMMQNSVPLSLGRQMTSFFFEVFDRFLVDVGDVGPFLSWHKLSDCGVELIVDSA